jgi:hypothetical protein
MNKGRSSAPCSLHFRNSRANYYSARFLRGSCLHEQHELGYRQLLDIGQSTLRRAPALFPAGWRAHFTFATILSRSLFGLGRHSYPFIYSTQFRKFRAFLEHTRNIRRRLDDGSNKTHRKSASHHIYDWIIPCFSALASGPRSDFLQPGSTQYTDIYQNIVKYSSGSQVLSQDH